MSVSQNLALLRRSMEEDGIDYLLIPTADYHLSEYICDHFKLREHFSGFTGSAGVLVVGHQWAGLWTDSRYHIQAAQQLKNTPITLYCVGNPGVPKVFKKIEEMIAPEETLAVDGRTISVDYGQELEEILQKAKAKCRLDWTCPQWVWPQRPALPRAYLYRKEGTGETAQQKLQRLRDHMKTQGASAQLLTSMDDIAWLLNLRGDDVANNPVFLSYLWVTMTGGVLFVNPQQLTPSVSDYLDTMGLTTKPYDAIEEHCQLWRRGPVLVTPSVVNARLYQLLGERTLHGENFVAKAKAIKTPQEQENLRQCHQRDACAMIEFLRWLEESMGAGLPLSEQSVADKIDSLRHEQPGNIGLSFPTISAYGGHGAIVHYSVSPESDATLHPQGFLLLDSGGQYTDGTTDITRTISLGAISATMRRHYTLVLRGCLALSAAVFPQGTTGATLDMLARSPLWEAGLDYGHGTGHGVGYCLNVHEGPQSISHQRVGSPAMEAGMVTSDEPGLYLKGKYGIRLENLILCQESEKTEFGDFLTFEILTLVPFDLRAIDKGLLTDVDRARLNDYHQRVYTTMAPLLKEADRYWLEKATRPV